MAIDGIDNVGGAADAVRRINEERDLRVQQETQQKDAGQIEQERAKEQGACGQALNDPNQDSPISADIRLDQGIIESEGANGSGAEKSEQAVNTANAQQDRGEDWQQFSETQEERELPPTVEEQSKQAEENTERNKGEELINAAELINQMEIASKKINC